MKSKLLFASVLTMALAACGGGGGSGDKGSDVPDRAPETEKGTTNGKASHGPVVDAQISAYDFDGNRDKHRGSTRTDSEGKYQLQLQVADRPILMSSQGGSYVDEASGRSVQMGNDELTAVIFYEAGKNIEVQLTYFTTLATCRAEYLINRQDRSVGNAINIANNEWSAILGVDIVGVQPVDVTKPSAFTPFMTPAHQYGIALAGVSELVEKIRNDDGADESNSAYTVKYFTRVACNDIRFDGKLDGIGAATAGNPSGQLYIGSTALNLDLYRRSLGQGVINFGGNKNNTTGLGASDFLELANGISTSSSAVFGEVEGTPVDNEGPVVTSGLAQGSLVNDVENIAFTVGDPLGVKSVTFYIDGLLYGEGQPSNPILVWDTSGFSEGEHTVTVKALDVLDNETSQDFVFQVVNDGPGIAFTSPRLVNSTTYLAEGTFVDNGGGVDRLLVNGTEAVIDENNGTWAAEVSLLSGENIVQAVIVDSLSNESSLETVVSVDIINPTLNVWSMPAAFTNYDGLLNRCESGQLDDLSGLNRPVCLNAEKISLDGAEVNHTLASEGYVVISADIGDPQGAGVFSDIAELSVSYRYIVGQEVKVDWSPIIRSNMDLRLVYLPFTTEFLGDDFYQSDIDTVHKVELRVSDRAGNQVSRSYAVKLDVITPSLNFDTSITESVFPTEYSERSDASGRKVIVTYDYINSSSLDVALKIDATDAHKATNAYVSSIRKNVARQVVERSWSLVAYDCRPPVVDNCDGWGDTRSLDDVTSIRMIKSTGSFSYIKTLTLSDTYGDWETVDSDTIEPTTENSRDSDPQLSTCFYYSSSPHCLEPNDFQFPGPILVIDASVEYQSGYPRNESEELTTDYDFGSSTVRVLNVSHGTTIHPVDGWYLVPKGVDIRIEKELELPTITHYFDSRVSQDAANTPYSHVISEDKETTWVIDSDINISRAVYPGSIDDLDSVSLSESTVGNGQVTFSVVSSSF